MRRITPFALCIVAIGFAIPPARARSADPAKAAVPVDMLAGSRRVDRNRWIYVCLEGSPAQVGFQHGYWLASEIRDLLAMMKPYLHHQTKRDWTFYREAAISLYWPRIDAEYQAEIDGIVAGLAAQGVEIDRYDLVALNGYIELSEYYLPWLEKKQGAKPAHNTPGSCSAFVATGNWTSDRRIVMGHNLWVAYAIGSYWNVIFDIAPEQGHRIFMDGLPGVIASNDDFGVNSDGIMVTETTITQFHGFDPKGRPEFVRARQALQYSSSIDDYVRIMRDGNNGAYANDWLLGDNKTGEIARFELGLANHSVERTTDGYFVGSNFPVGENLIRNETTFDVSNKSNSANARHTRWKQLMAEYKGRIDVEIARQFESDGHDAFADGSGPNERTLCGCVELSPRGIPEWSWPSHFPGGTAQAKAMDSRLAERMQMWAAYGHPCAPDFRADEFLKTHAEYEWMRGLLRDMPTGEWTLLSSGMK